MYKRNLVNAFLTSPIFSSDTELNIDYLYYSIMPTTPFYMTIAPAGELSTMSNSEIVLVTENRPLSLTVVRGQKHTKPKEFQSGDILTNGIYAEMTANIGDIVMTLNDAPSMGRLFMDGSTHSKKDYPLLYSHVLFNKTYGTTTTDSFTLADMRTRMPVGSGDNYILGSTGGFERTRHVNTLWGIAAGAFRHSGTNYLNSLKPLLNQWLTGDGSSSELTYKSSVANVGGALGQEANNPIERLWYEYTSSNMPPYIVVNYEVIAG